MRGVVGSGSLGNLRFLRRDGHCCAGGHTTTRVLNFVNASSGKLDNLRCRLSSILGNDRAACSGLRSTINGRLLNLVIGSPKRRLRPGRRGLPAICLALSDGVRCILRSTVSSTVTHAGTGNTTTVVVSPCANRVLNVTDHPAFSPGGFNGCDPSD